MGGALPHLPPCRFSKSKIPNHLTQEHSESMHICYGLDNYHLRAQNIDGG